MGYSPTMKLQHFFAFLSLAFASTASLADSLELKCGSPGTEKASIRKFAPDLVVRKSKRQLLVKTKAGIQAFNDKPPFDEPFSGVQHEFCDRKDGFMLVGVSDEDVRTGKLVNEQTGVVTNAGSSVQFSNDRRAYLTWEQPDDLDGDWLKVYSVDGKMSWSGFNYIEDGSPDKMFASLEDVAWLPNGELGATARCVSEYERHWSVKLVKRNDRWSWQPRGKCPVKQ